MQCAAVRSEAHTAIEQQCLTNHTQLAHACLTQRMCTLATFRCKAQQPALNTYNWRSQLFPAMTHCPAIVMQHKCQKWSWPCRCTPAESMAACRCCGTGTTTRSCWRMRTPRDSPAGNRPSWCAQCAGHALRLDHRLHGTVPPPFAQSSKSSKTPCSMVSPPSERCSAPRICQQVEKLLINQAAALERDAIGEQAVASLACSARVMAMRLGPPTHEPPTN